MAPIPTDTHSKYLAPATTKTTNIMSSSSPTYVSDGSFVSVYLGSGPDKETLSLPVPPPANAKTEQKALALKSVFGVLTPFASKYSTSALSSPIRSPFGLPTNVPETEAALVSQLLTAAFLDPDTATMEAVSFVSNKFTPSQIPAMLTARKKKGATVFRFVLVESTLDTRTVDPRIPAVLASATVHFYLGLPQSLVDRTETDADSTTPRQLESEFDDTVPASVRKAVLSPDGASTSGKFNYVGPLDFLDSKAKFTAIFGDFPNLYSATADIDASSRSISPTDCFAEFVRPRAFAVLKSLLWLDYVGHEVPESLATHVIQASLSSIKHIYYVSEKKKFRSPEAMYTEFLKYIPLLPTTDADVSTWGFNLPLLFWTGLSTKLQGILTNVHSTYKYTFPTQQELSTFQGQTKALRSLRSMAQNAYEEHDANCATIRNMIHSARNPTTRTTTHATLTDTADPDTTAAANPTDAPATGLTIDQLRSEITTGFTAALQSATAHVCPAESVLNRYKSSLPKPTGDKNPTDPITGYTSKYPMSFRGCLLCGKEDHSFKDCGVRETVAQSRVKFHREFFAKFPDRRRFPVSYAEHQLNEQDGVRPPAGYVAPAPPSDTPTLGQPRETPNDATTPATRKARLFPLFAAPVAPAAALALAHRPFVDAMPIQIQNTLPMIALELHSLELGGLADTGASLTSGRTDFHDYIRQTFPDCVAEYLEFNDTDRPFHPIQLLGAIDHPENYSASEHGLLTAVVTYKTTYRDSSGNPFHLKVALGPNCAVNTIFGITTLTAMGASIDLPTNELRCSVISATLPITYRLPKRGVPILPPSVSFSTPVATQFSAPLFPVPSPPPPQPESMSIDISEAYHRLEVAPDTPATSPQPPPATSPGPFYNREPFGSSQSPAAFLATIDDPAAVADPAPADTDLPILLPVTDSTHDSAANPAPVEPTPASDPTPAAAPDVTPRHPFRPDTLAAVRATRSMTTQARLLARAQGTEVANITPQDFRHAR